MLVAPAKAAADVFLSGFGGATFIDDGKNKGNFGGGIGLGGLVSVEFEAARTPLGNYTGIPAVDLNAHLSTYMGNLMFRLPRGPIQPYVSAGAGIVRLSGSVDVPFLGSVFSASADDVGWNFGGGVMFLPSTNIGLVPTSGAFRRVTCRGKRLPTSAASTIFRCRKRISGARQAE